MNSNLQVNKKLVHMPFLVLTVVYITFFPHNLSCIRNISIDWNRLRLGTDQVTWPEPKVEKSDSNQNRFKISLIESERLARSETEIYHLRLANFRSVQVNLTVLFYKYVKLTGPDLEFPNPW